MVYDGGIVGKGMAGSIGIVGWSAVLLDFRILGGVLENAYSLIQ